MRTRFVLALAFPFFWAMGVGGPLAQASGPNENPTANTGALKSQIETGGSYDAHSGNATRVVPDLRVPGALGDYGLDFIRYYNSLRYDRIQNTYLNPAPEPNPPTDFGAPGWSHSWRWSADYEEYLQEVGGDGGDEIYHMLITITFPDGRASKYKIIRTKLWPYGQPWVPDPRFGPPFLAAHGETNWVGGFHDQLADMAEDGSEFWLYRADGGSVHFTAGPYGYLATEVFDPHGFKTTLTYNAVNWQLERVEQEGGRHLKIFSNGGGITRVESGGTADTQAVDYHYQDGLLTSVTYQNDPSPGQTTTAEYTYQTLDPPTGFFNAGPLLATAKDPRFEGPMTFISYSYRGTGCRPQGQPQPGYTNGQLDYYYASPTAIAEEKNALTGEVVSGFGIGCFDGTRTEDNGLGGHRKFFFGHSAMWPGSGSFGYQLAKVTDFNNGDPLAPGVPFERQSNLNGHPYEVWDGRGIKTRLTHGDGSGLPSEIRHVGSDGSFSSYDRVNPGNSDPQDFTRLRNPYHHWLFSKTDERGLTTTYRRDARRRVTDIIYPDTNSEHFSYNILNQVETHTLPSGAIETYEYDPTTHRLMREYNSVDRTLHGVNADKEYTYDALGRVETTKEGRARINGKDFSTRMTYNGRHQIIAVEYAGMIGATNNPTVRYGYDAYGNCTWISDELAQYPQDPNHTKRYEYDFYRRCTAYIEPLNAPGWNGTASVSERRWEWIYDRYIPGIGGKGASTHTGKSWRIQIEPAFNAAGDRRLTARLHDLENRVTLESSGWIVTANGSWVYGSDAETHSYTFDANGNKSSYTDPQGRLATYDYDLRNRLWKTNETVNTLPRTTEILYDVTGNKTLVTFPDLKTQQWLDYTPFGQAERFIDERGNTTNLNHQWGPMDKLASVVTHRDRDGGGTEDQLTTFEYDGMGRPTWTIFPDTSSELTTYLFGQVDAFKTRKNQTKRLHYDARGREDYHTWDSDAAPRIDRQWDAANRLTSISNSFSAVDYGYDSAGQVLSEGNTIAGSGARVQTTFSRYPNGDVAHLVYPDGFPLRKDYTARGQLKTVGMDDGNGNWIAQFVNYTYLPDGKVDHQDYLNGPTSTATFGYDGRGFTSSVLHTRTASGQPLSSRTYARDSRDRVISWVKGTDATINPMENGRGNRYDYDNEGQLTHAYYGALAPGGNVNSWGREDHFDYDALGNRRNWDYIASRGQWMNFTRKDNGLNQYRAWWPYSYTNYDDDIGGTWGAPGAANGVIMQDGWITAGFNALNQPMYIWSANVRWTYFGYDPLGRCVKRWVGSDGSAGANPATYLYYDGWSLIQEGPSAATPGRIYVHGARIDQLLCSYQYSTGLPLNYYYDAMGHCTLVTHTGLGNILEQYDYDAFGKPYFYDGSGNLLPNGSTVGNRFLFAGREWLSDLKIYDFRNRMYQPELGRFLQPDPKHFGAGDYNLYRYCHNDPVNKTDPTGMELVVDPSTPFVFQMLAWSAIGELSATESGGPAVLQLMTSPNLHVITMMTQPDAGRTEVSKPNSLTDATNRTGTGSTLKIDPFHQVSSKETMGSKIAHATGHAQEFDKGTSKRPPDQSKPMDPLRYMRDPSEQNANKLELEYKKYKEEQAKGGK
jgi:RHS repeat-associated protein